MGNYMSLHVDYKEGTTMALDVDDKEGTTMALHVHYNEELPWPYMCFTMGNYHGPTCGLD